MKDRQIMKPIVFRNTDEQLVTKHSEACEFLDFHLSIDTKDWDYEEIERWQGMISDLYEYIAGSYWLVRWRMLLRLLYLKYTT